MENSHRGGVDGMKIRNAICSLAVLLFAASCGSSGNDPVPAGSVAIRLYTGLETLTRGEEPGMGTADSVCFAKGDSPGKYNTVWKADVSKGIATLREHYTYPADDKPLYLRGFFPVADMEEGEVRYRLDGHTDVLLTTEREGRLTDMYWQESKRFYFAHCLTQVSFRVLAEGTFKPAESRLIRLEISGTRSSMVLRPADGRSRFEGEVVPWVAYQAEEGDGIVIGVTESDLFGTLLLEPGRELRADAEVVRTSDGRVTYYKNVLLRLENGETAQAGKSYRVTLRFGVKGDTTAGLTAGMSDWTWINEHIDIEAK